MTIPNFFKYGIMVDKQEIGTIRSPCKKIAKLTWEQCALCQFYPNAKIKFKGINFKRLH
jgi:hypothetical protein